MLELILGDHLRGQSKLAGKGAVGQERLFHCQDKIWWSGMRRGGDCSKQWSPKRGSIVLKNNNWAVYQLQLYQMSTPSIISPIPYP